MIECIVIILTRESQVYNFTYKLHFTTLDYWQNFEGVSNESVWSKSLADHGNVDKFVQVTCSV